MHEKNVHDVQCSYFAHNMVEGVDSIGYNTLDGRFSLLLRMSHYDIDQN